MRVRSQTLNLILIQAENFEFPSTKTVTETHGEFIVKNTLGSKLITDFSIWPEMAKKNYLHFTGKKIEVERE